MNLRYLSEVVGQRDLKRILSKSLHQECFPHCVIFHGQPGVGKTTLARIVAASLLCEKGPGEACGICPTCKAVFESRYMEVHELDAALYSGVEEIKILIEGALYKPKIGLRRIFIIDECQRLSLSAFSATLKTLEESPEFNYFILLTTNLEKIPENVQSRSVRFNFTGVEDEELVKLLSSQDVDESLHRDLIDLAEGRPRNLLNLIKLSKFVGEPELLYRITGMADRRLIWSWILALRERRYLLLERLNHLVARRQINSWGFLNSILKRLTRHQSLWSQDLFKDLSRAITKVARWRWMEERLILGVVTSLILPNRDERLFHLLRDLALAGERKLFWKVQRHAEILSFVSPRRICLLESKMDKFELEINRFLESKEI